MSTTSESEIRITAQAKKYENDYGVLYDDQVQFLPQGTTGTYVRWKWKAPFSVAILPITNSKEAILLNSFRHAARGPVLEAPKGFGSSAVEPRSVAIAELREEMGLICEIPEYVGEAFTDPAFTCHPMHLFLAWDCEPTSSSHESSEVIIDCQTVRLNDVPSLLAAGNVKDSTTLLLLWEAFYRLTQ